MSSFGQQPEPHRHGEATGRKAGVVIASNRAAAGIYRDETGPVITDWLTEHGFETFPAMVVPDGEPVGALGALWVTRLSHLKPSSARPLEIAWRLHVQPTDPGWVDIGRETPLLDTTRARTELGWTPQYDAAQALLETIDAMSAGRGGGFRGRLSHPEDRS